MNENDIIKALECCHVGKRERDCKKCPLYCRVPACVGHLTKDALDLIRRQQAEIECLTLENRKLTETNNALNYQIDTWSPSEAIKGFAEKLKEKGFADQYYEHESIIYVADIDDLVKEMTEVHHD